MWMCIHMFNHVSEFVCLTYIVTCVSSTRGCTVVYFAILVLSRVQSTVISFQAQNVIYDKKKKKKSDYPDITRFFFKRVLCSVVSDSLWPRGLCPTRPLCPWGFSNKNTAVSCHVLLQGIFPTQGSNPGLLHCRRILYHLSQEGRQNGIQQGTRTCAINIRHKWHCSCPQSPIADDPSAPPALTSSPPPVSHSSCLFTGCQPLFTSCCTVLLYFSRHSTVRLEMLYFLCLFFMYYLCEKCYKPIIVQYYIANCVSWVPRLTLLDLSTNLTYEHVLVA